jgi:hypothetical protein
MDVIDGGFVCYDISLLGTSFSSPLSNLRQLATLDSKMGLGLPILGGDPPFFS